MTVCLCCNFNKIWQNSTKEKIVFISKPSSYSFTKLLGFIKPLSESCILEDLSISYHKAKYRGNRKHLCLVFSFSVPKLEKWDTDPFFLCSNHLCIKKIHSNYWEGEIRASLSWASYPAVSPETRLIWFERFFLCVMRVFVGFFFLVLLWGFFVVVFALSTFFFSFFF